MLEGKKLQYLSVVLPLKIEQKYKRNVNVNILILKKLTQWTKRILHLSTL